MQESGPKFNTSGTLYTIGFVVVLSFICALILSSLASILQEPQAVAKELDRSTQMLIAARIMSPYGHFLVKDPEGAYVPAKLTAKGVLVPSKDIVIPGREQILEVYRRRIQGFLIDAKGNPETFEQAKINEGFYTNEYRKTGYYKQPLKLIYKIFSNTSENGSKEGELPVEGYVIPVNGMGLWDAIYGYLAIKPDGDTVIGISWYDQKETPGLGANITEADWQSQFPGKKIFQETSDGRTIFETAQLGLNVIKGKVKEVLGDSSKSKSAIDGMAGATLTGNGVTGAYKDVLAAYRPFLIRIHEENAGNQDPATNKAVI